MVTPTVIVPERVIAFKIPEIERRDRNFGTNNESRMNIITSPTSGPVTVELEKKLRRDAREKTFRTLVGRDTAVLIKFTPVRKLFQLRWSGGRFPPPDPIEDRF
jgi:hypothetical protein